MIFVFQLLLVLFAIFAIFNVIRRQKEGLLGPKGGIFWVLFWLGVALVVIWPVSVQRLADHIGIGRGADLVIYISLAGIFFILFRLNIKLEGLRRDLTEVVREEALSPQHWSTKAHEHREKL